MANMGKEEERPAEMAGLPAGTGCLCRQQELFHAVTAAAGRASRHEHATDHHGRQYSGQKCATAAACLAGRSPSSRLDPSAGELALVHLKA